MRIVNISDTHGKERTMLHNPTSFINPNDENILLHSGDISNIGGEQEVKDFVDWFCGLEGFDLKVFIAGNHELSFEFLNHKPYDTYNEPFIVDLINNEKLIQHNVVYLEDNYYICRSKSLGRELKIYGSPWQPEFFNWAFNLPINGNELAEKWGKIPADTDILLTHGPAYGVLDLTPQRQNVGCPLLRNRIGEIKPLLHICGHIHHSYGETEHNEVYHVNASICDEKYRPNNRPIILDLHLDENNDITINGG